MRVSFLQYCGVVEDGVGKKGVGLRLRFRRLHAVAKMSEDIGDRYIQLRNIFVGPCVDCRATNLAYPRTQAWSEKQPF